MITTERPTQLLIGGSWRPGEGEKTFDVVEPATSDVMARAAVASPADVDAAVKAARAAFEAGAWSNAAASARAKVLYKIAELIRSNAERLATRATR
ncbi:MAG: aldehyde dehydrogenase family protein [Chloroflexi bacterium]|nr:MAG: aldehyde dehydrogenase family protein [Chloroflexota bacterium]